MQEDQHARRAPLRVGEAPRELKHHLVALDSLQAESVDGLSHEHPDLAPFASLACLDDGCARVVRIQIIAYTLALQRPGPPMPPNYEGQPEQQQQRPSSGMHRAPA